MCLQTASTPAAAARQKRQSRRSCHWVYDRPTTLRLLEDGIAAPAVTITTDRGQWTYVADGDTHPSGNRSEGCHNRA